MSGLMLMIVMGFAIEIAWISWPSTIKKTISRFDNTEWTSIKKLTGFVFCLATVEGVIRATIFSLLFLLACVVLAALLNLPGLAATPVFAAAMFGYVGYTTLKALQFCAFELKSVITINGKQQN